MDRKAPILDQYLMVISTNRARSQVDSIIAQARAMEQDEDQAARLARHFCKGCHYPRRMAGQAFTNQPCACCAEPQTYSSTSTDNLCLPCAKEHSLCKHCAGDLEMRVGRRKWPEVPRPATTGVVITDDAQE
jgi:hypothetical protein